MRFNYANNSFHNIPVKIIKRKNAKRLTLRTDQFCKKILITLPALTSKKQAINFLHEKSNWILQQIDKNNYEFYPHQKIKIFGDMKTLNHDSSIRSFTETDDEITFGGEILSFNRRVISYLNEMTISKANYLFNDWQKTNVFRQENNEKIISKPLFLAGDMKSRWGSCSHNGKIKLSFRLTLAPFYVFEYVTAHEIAHLRFFDHSKEFWQFVDKIYPNTKLAKTWLKINAKQLFKYGIK